MLSLWKQCSTFSLETNTFFVAFFFNHTVVSSITFRAQPIDMAGENEGWSEVDVCPCAVVAHQVNIGRELSTSWSSSEALLWLQ